MNSPTFCPFNRSHSFFILASERRKLYHAIAQEYTVSTKHFTVKSSRVYVFVYVLTIDETQNGWREAVTYAIIWRITPIFLLKRDMPDLTSAFAAQVCDSFLFHYKQIQHQGDSFYRLNSKKKANRQEISLWVIRNYVISKFVCSAFRRLSTVIHGLAE